MAKSKKIKRPPDKDTQKPKKPKKVKKVVLKKDQYDNPDTIIGYGW